jgi:hypothetical protein
MCFDTHQKSISPTIHGYIRTLLKQHPGTELFHLVFLPAPALRAYDTIIDVTTIYDCLSHCDKYICRSSELKSEVLYGLLCC